jgi:pyruvate/2-oxoglutarate dehydrogenase complex dihydrolipoamide acyltransferase (E2) component
MLGDDRIREYDHANVGMALSRPDDELVVVVVRRGDTMDVMEFAHACRIQMRVALRSGDQATEDTQILISHLGKSGIIDAVPTLVAPASSVFFLGAPRPDTGLARIALTFDHRLINGGGAAAFLADVGAHLAAS